MTGTLPDFTQSKYQVCFYTGFGSTTAISIALLDRVINYWSIVVGGVIVYLWSRRKKK